MSGREPKIQLSDTMTDGPAPKQSDAHSAEEWLYLQSLNGKRLMITTQHNEIEGYMNVQQAMEAYAALRERDASQRAIEKAISYLHEMGLSDFAKQMKQEFAYRARERYELTRGTK